jgi:sporulation protein YtfJ
MAKIKEMVDVNTIVGDPVVSADGSTIIPISKVSFGFISGGGEYGGGSQGSSSSGENSGNSFPFAGGAGSGICVTPVGFLVVDECNVQLLPVSGPTLVEQAIESIPQLIAEIKDAVCGRKNEEGE